MDGFCWFGSTLAVTGVSCAIAYKVPQFDNLVSLTGALFGPALAILPSVAIWLRKNLPEVKKNPSFRKCAMVVFCVLVSLFAVFLMVSGAYGSISGMKNAQKA